MVPTAYWRAGCLLLAVSSDTEQIPSCMLPLPLATVSQSVGYSSVYELTLLLLEALLSSPETAPL